MENQPKTYGKAVDPISGKTFVRTHPRQVYESQVTKRKMANGLRKKYRLDNRTRMEFWQDERNDDKALANMTKVAGILLGLIFVEAAVIGWLCWALAVSAR